MKEEFFQGKCQFVFYDSSDIVKDNVNNTRNIERIGIAEQRFGKPANSMYKGLVREHDVC